jgi:FdhE protein
MKAALERAREMHPELGEILAVSTELEAADEGRAPEGFAVSASARLAAGRPAIDPAALELDWEAVARRIAEVAAVVVRRGTELDLAADAATARALARRFLDGDDAGGPLVTFVLTHALRPFLRPLAAAALALPEAGRWDRGSCPACGGPPDLAVLEGEGGARRLLCSRCDAEWRYARLGCPRCANQDPKRLGYFPAGAGAHRLYVCDACKGYLKTLDRRESFGGAPLPVERLLTVGLDLAAAEAGYGPCAAGPGAGESHAPPSA